MAKNSNLFSTLPDITQHKMARTWSFKEGEIDHKVVYQFLCKVLRLKLLMWQTTNAIIVHIPTKYNEKSNYRFMGTKSYICSKSFRQDFLTPRDSLNTCTLFHLHIMYQCWQHSQKFQIELTFSVAVTWKINVVMHMRQSCLQK